MYPNWIPCLTGILIVSLTLRTCHAEEQQSERPRRAIEYPIQWRPVSVAPGNHGTHDHLISIANFDTSNKAQLAQIAHHNAHILRHIKRVPGVPVTQYLNPFPMFTGSGVQTSAAGGASLSSSSIVDHHPISHSASGASGPGAGKHFIVQTSNVVIHPAPAPTGASITSAPLHAAHPNSLLTSSSNMAQTIIPFGHHHKHQYFVGAAKQPAFLLGKPSELSGGAFKFLNTIHPTSTGKNSFPGLLKTSVMGVHHQPSTSIFSSTTSRIPIIRDSTLAPLAYHRGSTAKPSKLQSHLTLAQRAKPPTGPHLDELSAHQSHLISSLAQFAAAPNVLRAAEVAQNLPRPQQGPAFTPLSDHFGPFFKNGFGAQMRFPSAVQPPPNTMSSVQFGHQQQLRQQFAQQQQQLHAQQQLQAQHKQQIKELEHVKHQLKHQQQQQHSQPQSNQQHSQLHHIQQAHSHSSQHNQQLSNQHHGQQSNLLPQQPTQQLPSPQSHNQFNQHQQFQSPSQHHQQQQLPSQHQDQNFQNSQQQSQHQESFYQPTQASHNQSKYETSHSQDHHLNFELPFKKIPSFDESSTSSTRSPQAYLPPLPNVAPSVLSPFFQQVQQQQHQHDLDEQQEQADQQRQLKQQQQLQEDDDRRQERDRLRDQQQYQHFYFSSTSAPVHQVEIRPSPPDNYISQQLNQSAAFNNFHSNGISYHHQIEAHQLPPNPSIPPFNRLEDEFTLNLVPPPSYPSHKDTTLFRRPVQGTRGPPSTVLPSMDPEQLKAIEILNKYNIPAISPLQDANRFAYNARPAIVSSAAPPTPSTVSQFHLEVPSPTSLTHFTTTKPNVFRQLNRPAESEYKQHKVMHPLYTGGPKRPGGAAQTFAAATNAPARDSSAVTHNFFTIEDAVTLSPQINNHNQYARPTSTGQIEANLNRPHEEEITEVITLRSTSSDDDELLQHLDANTSSKPSSSRPKHRRRRPRPSSTSTSTTEQVEEEEQTQKPHDDYEPEKQGHWETNRVPSNHRETPAEPTVTTTKETPPIPPPRHRSRHRGRPSVNALPVEAITSMERQPSRQRRPVQRPDEPKPTNIRVRTTQPPPTTEIYEEPVTMDLRDNIFLANLQQRRRPPHSTKSTVFAPISTATTHFKPITSASQDERYERFNTRVMYTTTTSSPPETETMITTRGTRPTILTTNAYQNHQTNPVEQSTNNELAAEPEEMTMASETISNTVVRLEPTTPTDTTTTTTTKVSPTSALPNLITSAEAPETSANPNIRIRQRLRIKDNELTSSIAPSTSSSTTVQNDELPDEPTENNELPDPTKYHAVSVRLPIVKDVTTTRTSDESNVNPLPPTRQNAIAKFDPKNRPRFSVKDYRQRLTVSSTATASHSSPSTTEATSTTPATTTRSRYPTRSRVLPDLRIKPGTRTTSSQAYSEEQPSTSSSSNSVSDESEIPRKRFMPKERRPYSTTPSTTSESSERPSRTTTASPASGRSTRTRNPTSRRTFSSSSTTPSSIESSVTRTPTIRKFPSISLRRPPQPSLRQRIAISQQKKTSTEAPVTSDPSIGSAVTEPTNLNKLFNLDDSELEDRSPMGLEEMDDESIVGSTNTENYKLETAIMKIAKDDHSYRPYAHSTSTPRSRSRTTAAPPSTTEPMTPQSETADDEETLRNQIGASSDDLNGSPSEHSERVAELTRFGANQFQSVNTAVAASGTSRRVPGYFTIATEDPILPIEAFFPKMSGNSSNRGK